MQEHLEMRSLTSGRTLAQNTFWNALGVAGPMTMAVIAIPILIHNLGAARFGVLTLIWGMVRYSSYCDFGAGTALTKLIADRLGTDRAGSIPSLLWTSLAFMFLAGTLVGAVVAILCPWLVTHVLKIPVALQHEATVCFYILSSCMPFLIVTGGLRGAFAAFQRFDAINAVRGPMDILSYVGLGLLATLNGSVIWMVAMLMAVRFVGCVIYFVATLQLIPGLSKIRFDRAIIPALLQFGGWMTITNVINPLLTDFERFLIGALISIEAVAYYNTSLEVLSKLWQIPLMLESVWFSAFAHSLAQVRSSMQGSGEANFRVGRLFERGEVLIFALMFPAVVILAGFSREILGLWIGGSFGTQTAPVFRWLAMVVLISSFSEMPSLLIQAAHRPDFTGKLRLIEIPFSLLLVWTMALWRGVEGVAIAVLIRVAFDTIAVSAFAHRLFPSAVAFWNRVSWMSAAGAIVFVLGQLNLSIPGKAVLVLSILAIFVISVWRLLLYVEDRQMVVRVASRTLSRVFSTAKMRAQAAED
jgi:O-antigen/teichoic acid export membrane protein